MLHIYIRIGGLVTVNYVASNTGSSTRQSDPLNGATVTGAPVEIIPLGMYICMPLFIHIMYMCAKVLYVFMHVCMYLYAYM
jgi:type IV secretory pathway VirB3-like protein